MIAVPDTFWGLVLYKYLIALTLLGGLSLVGLMLWFGVRRAWGRVYAEEMETLTQERKRDAKSSTPKRRKRKKHNELVDGVAGEVVRVVDGDTMDVALSSGGEVRVRVLGLDTPEKRRGTKVNKDAERSGSSVTQQIELGEEATTRAMALLMNKRVKLESGRADRGPRKDVFDRYLAYLILPGGKDYGLIMIKEGHGECFGWKYPHPRQEVYEKAQKKAPNRLKRKRGWFARSRKSRSA